MLVKNPDYKGNRVAKNDGVTFKVYTDDSAAYRDIQAGNLVYKTLVHTADCKNGCILTGTKVPAILTSRSDSFQTRSTPSHWLLWSQRGWISNCKKPSPSGEGGRA